MDVEVAFSGVPVSDFEPGRDFFRLVLGRPADIVVVPGTEEMWRLTDSAWLYVVADPTRAGHALVALSVSALDEVLSELAGRGITPKAVEEHGDGARKATVLDPDGNTVALIEVPNPSSPQA
jgi:hypothetical protein